jgi:hypothetical protein
MMEVVKEGVRDDQFDTTTATRTSSSVTAVWSKKIGGGAAPQSGLRRGKEYEAKKRPSTPSHTTPLHGRQVRCACLRQFPQRRFPEGRSVWDFVFNLQFSVLA